MIALLLLLLALGLGVSVVRWSGMRLNWFEFVGASVVLGFIGFSWLMLLPSLLLPYVVSLPVGAVLTLALAALLWRRGSWRGFEPLTGGVRVAWSVLAGLAVIFWVTLNWTHALNPVHGTVMSAGSTWADFGLHSNLITHQAYASKLPMDMPVASGTNLTYPFLVDWLSALFLKGGWSLHMALTIPGSLLMWSITQLLIGFGRRLFGSFAGAVLGTVLTFTAGSFIGLTLAWHDYSKSAGLSKFLGNIPQGYAGSWEHNAQFFNPVVDLLMPQRAFLFGLGGFLCAAILWHRAVLGDAGMPVPEVELSKAERRRATRSPGSAPIDAVGRRTLLLGCVVLGLMPLCHAHSFIATSTLMAGLLVWVFLHRREELRTWLGFLGIAVVLALPQLAWQQFGVSNGTGGHWVSVWMRSDGDPVVAYLWRNFGFFLLLMLAMVVLLSGRAFAQWRPWLIPFLVLFVLALFYSIQPLAYDNLKLYFYTYMMTMLAFGALLMRVRLPFSLQLSRLVRAGAVALVLILMGTGGLLSIVRDYQLKYQFASVDDVALANWVREHTGINAVFAGTTSTGESPGTLGGRRLVAAYDGWLVNYNLDLTGRKAAIAAAMRGDLSDPSLIKYHPDYVFISVSDTGTDPAGLAKLEKVYSNPTWTVYRIPPV